MHWLAKGSDDSLLSILTTVWEKSSDKLRHLSEANLPPAHLLPRVPGLNFGEHMLDISRNQPQVFQSAIFPLEFAL